MPNIRKVGNFNQHKKAQTVEELIPACVTPPKNYRAVSAEHSEITCNKSTEAK
jgi:hypothetical protein